MREESCAKEYEEAPYIAEDLTSHHQVASSMGDEFPYGFFVGYLKGIPKEIDTLDGDGTYFASYQK